MANHQIRRAGVAQAEEKHGQGIAGEAIDVARIAPAEDGCRHLTGAFEKWECPSPRIDDPLLVPQSAQCRGAHRQVARPELPEMPGRARKERTRPAVVNDRATDGRGASRVALPS